MLWIYVRTYFFSRRKTARKSPSECGGEGGRKGRCAFLWAIVGGEVVEDKRWIFAGYSATKACQREFHFVNTIRGGDTYTQALQKCHRKIRHRVCLFLPRPTIVRRVQYNNTGTEKRKTNEARKKNKNQINDRQIPFFTAVCDSVGFPKRAFLYYTYMCTRLSRYFGATIIPGRNEKRFKKREQTSHLGRGEDS